MPWLPAAVSHPCWLVGLFSVLHVACLLCILQSCTSCSAKACALCAQVDLPEDPAVKEMLSHKPAYGAVTTPKADANGKDGEPYALQPWCISCKQVAAAALVTPSRGKSQASRQAHLSLPAPAAKPRLCLTSERRHRNSLQLPKGLGCH